MKYIKKDENGIVVAASEFQFDDSYELSAEEYEVGFDGKLYSQTEMESEKYITQKSVFENDTQKNIIRWQRETECFSIINRGALWYEKLTTDQKEELSVWYQQWLDAPKTNIIPDAPIWLDNVSKQK